jgi:hypothetical protein
MEVVRGPEFDEERERLSFRFTCEDCAHFDDRRGSCLHGFPNALHRLDRYLREPRPATIVFCKDFDLA